jgi:hypothetical protein
MRRISPLIAALIVGALALGVASPSEAATRRPAISRKAARKIAKATKWSTRKPTRSSAPAPEPAPAPAPTTSTSGPYRLSVYYTAVEAYHYGAPVAVTGCPQQDCVHGSTYLGSYESDFVKAVKDEGTGRITSGEHTGQYLNWSSDTGYWLDTVPADSYGHALVPFHTAAAEGFLPRGTQFSIADCGVQGGEVLDPVACWTISAARWEIQDEFTPGLGGDGHIDLYIGEETGPRFTATSPLWFDVTGAAIQTVG